VTYEPEVASAPAMSIRASTVETSPASTNLRFGDLVIGSVRLYARHFLALAALVVILDWGPTLAVGYGFKLVPSGERHSLWVSPALTILYAFLDTALSVAVATALLKSRRGAVGRVIDGLSNVVHLAPTILPVAITLGLWRVPDLVRGPIVRAILSQRSVDATLRVATILLISSSASTVLLAATAVLIGIAPAVLAVERPGVLRALTRSFDLLSGCRLRLLGLWLIWLVVISLLRFIELHAGRALPAVEVVRLPYLAGALAYVVWPVMIALVYRNLLIAKEGWRQSDVAETFD
jgi:hypothetical protein